jgi:hypothetical protein
LAGSGIFLFATISRSAQLWDSLSLLSSGYGGGEAFSPGVGLSIHFQFVKIKNMWSFISTPGKYLHGMVFRHRGNFTFIANARGFVRILQQIYELHCLGRSEFPAGGCLDVTYITQGSHNCEEKFPK